MARPSRPPKGNGDGCPLLLASFGTGKARPSRPPKGNGDVAYVKEVRVAIGARPSRPPKGNGDPPATASPSSVRRGATVAPAERQWRQIFCRMDRRITTIWRDRRARRKAMETQFPVEHLPRAQLVARPSRPPKGNGDAFPGS